MIDPKAIASRVIHAPQLPLVQDTSNFLAIADTRLLSATADGNMDSQGASLCDFVDEDTLSA